MKNAPARAAPPALLAADVPNKWLVTLAIGFGSLMGSIDMSIVNVAMPQIRGSVGATIQEITWISTGYAVAMVIVMPLTAFLGRQFGQKRLYLFCLGVFVVGSALCGMARTLTTLLLFRFIQGLGAGALQPTQMAILRQTFPPKEQAMAMALFGMAIMLGPAAGPTLGGYIVDNWHWSWIFFINLPIGVLGYIMVSLFVREDRDILARNAAQAAAERRSVDWLGIALLSIGLSTLEYFLEEGATHDWFESPLIAVCCGIWFVTLTAFVIRELTIPVPAVNLRLFKDPVFASGTLIGAVMFMTLMASLFLFPIFMQELLGFTALKSGLVLMPRVLVMFVAMPIVGWVYARTDPRAIIAVGIVLNAIGAFVMSHLTLESGARDILIPNVVQGIGFACLFVPLTTVAMSKVPRHRLADAAGLNSLLRQVGGAVGLAIFASLLTNTALVARAGLRAHVTEANPIVQQRLAAIQAGLAAHGMDPAAAKAAALATLQGTVMRQSLALSFERLFLLGGMLFLLVFPLLFFLKVDRKALSAEVHAE
jgi:MFS transporter, DHA2 family, multidrug resistance protein